MKKLLIIAAAAAMALTQGCMSDAQVKYMTDGYAKFIEQPRDMELSTVEFNEGGGTITYTNVKRWTTRAPLDKLSIMPENPGTAREVVDGIVKVGAIAGAAYGIHELSESGGTTINNVAAP